MLDQRGQITPSPLTLRNTLTDNTAMGLYPPTMSPLNTVTGKGFNLNLAPYYNGPNTIGMLHKAEARALDLKTDFRQRKQKELLSQRQNSTRQTAIVSPLPDHHVVGFADDASVQNLPDASFIDGDINRDDKITRSILKNEYNSSMQQSNITLQG